MCHISTEIGSHNGLHHCWVLDFLGCIDLMPPWNAASVEVTNHIFVLTDGGNQVTFHDLHVVNIVEQFYARRIYLSHHPCSPRRMVCHVVRMVALAVQQLQTDGHAVVFGNLFHPVQAQNGVAGTLVVGHSTTVAGKGNYVWHRCLGCQRNVPAESGLDRSMVFHAVHGIGNCSSTGIAHRADQSVAAGNVPVLDLQQINSFQSDLCCKGTKTV